MLPLDAAPVGKTIFNGWSVRDFAGRVWPLLLFSSALGCLLISLVLQATGAGPPAQVFLIVAIVSVLARLLVEIVSKLRRGEFGLDLIAALSMSAALWFGQYLAGAIVSVMYAGGHLLEFYAHSRAESGMTDLLSRVPRTASRISENGLVEIPIAAIGIDDKLLIRRGDIVPVDGRVESLTALVDQSALTGEPLPVRLGQGQPVMSGASNAGDAFEMIAARPAAESTYASIVRLVEEAKQSKAPIFRVADQFGLLFLVLTVSVAILAVTLSGDSLRLLAVLVVATPCPLLLAVPVAFVSGTSHAARHGILVKGAAVIEALSNIRTVVFDKTGTLTIGQPAVTDIDCKGDANELLRLAGSAEQVSSHSIGRAIVSEAHRRGLALVRPEKATEVAGEGVEASVNGHNVLVGGPSFIASKISGALFPVTNVLASALVFVDGRYSGTICFEDTLREEAPETVAKLRATGIKRIILASGDRIGVARAVAEKLDLDAVEAELSAGKKVEIIRLERKSGPVMMIGDGVNDAPALAAADVGLAVARGNLAAASEAADVVLLRSDLKEIVTALKIGRRSKRIALQSVYAGIGLSAIAMLVAAFGFLPPVQGALIQEAIDVAVVLNALRALA
ncbi:MULTISPECIES: heavy metal translocating P-type ATPase [unclassified Rhizobium]|uniref:heavy metal translocating P-type ATPase n=1 Tax=unclassified Rhizobium TaxID=2613769 RepID=UPI001050F22C|nr:MULTISPECIES: heavy metal translocating P-type ATPase [unclassified Rhizobium]MBB3394180.1 heavy metal translocating P-type ATPase [Rhizobium sp. BK060]MBB4171939.1 heavy metal translocating P-type ATPase [Rhizobium sp. BK538]TCM63349.1 heavy metal-(Cd/Co/Hg/Pb/Zn)-translocating P-type ATPase [Rhizobium sp. BK068]